MPTYIRRPVRGYPSEYCYNVWGGKLECCGYQMVKTFEDIITLVDAIYERGKQQGRQTDGQTPHDGIGRA